MSEQSLVREANELLRLLNREVFDGNINISKLPRAVELVCNFAEKVTAEGKQITPKVTAGEPSSAPPAGEHKRQRCGHRTLHSCPSCGLCFSCCDCREFGKELGITFCDDIAEDGEGSTPWEVPAEPEPLYFETLKEAIKGYINMLSKECDKLESGAAQEVSPPSPWRQGSKFPTNIYEGDRPVCQTHTVADAERIVKAVNGGGVTR